LEFGLGLSRTIWIVDAHRDDGKRFVVRADEKLTAFMELESTVWNCAGAGLDQTSVLSHLAGKNYKRRFGRGHLSKIAHSPFL
jgi:hypothetical protein